ncbi:MAG: ATP-binding protein [Bacillota bacterium]|nr:ATP-binding protein [Bacillota bacterium]
MRLRSIQWRLVLILILLILLAMEFVGVYLLNSLERYYVTAVSSNLTSQAQLLAGFLQRNFTPYPDKQYAQTMARQFGQQSGGAVVVLDASGALVSASVGDPASLARFLIQGEVAKALSGVRSELIRLDPETNERNLHVIVPITSEQQVLGLVYMISSLEDTYRTLGDIRYILFTATGLAIGVTALVGWALARTITKPIEEVTKGAEIMSRGQFEASIAVRGRDEIGQLAQMFNLLGSRLRSTLDEIEEEKAKLETVLNSMTDGVIAVDPQNTVELANPAAGRFLAADTASLVGRPVEDVMSSLLTRDEIEAATSGGAVITKAIVSGSEDNTVLQVISASTRGEQGRSGTVFVLQDVTSQERLDSLRKEFVANVSHELKTPITTVKSYVETLIDGALVGGVARQFLEVILKETDRMSRLVRDLLDLSRIDYKQVAFDLRPVDPATLLRDSVRKLSVQAGNKGINLNIVADETPAVLADWDRLQQVVLNVVANSIEFTPQGGSVTLEAAENGEMVTFRIADTGIGIPQADLPRIFERFYRVDKARSRQMGGTGLGLAIAKEIIDAHKGRIRIESQVGKGTVVTFELPVAKVADEYA